MSFIKERIKEGFSWNLVWLVLFTVGFGIFFMATPKYLDDYWYMEHTYEWFEKQGVWNPDEGGNIFEYGIPWEGLGKIIEYHFRSDTSRVCNIVGPFVLLFPKWLGGLTALIALIYTVWGLFRLLHIDIRKSWLTGLALALWTLLPLWYNVMGTVIFQYNYVLSGALSVALLLAVRRKPRSVTGFTGFILLAILTAVWHEGFTVPLLAGFVTLIVFFKECRDKWTVTAAVIMLLGTIYHFAGTSTMERAQDLGYSGFDYKHVLITAWYHRGIWIWFIVSVAFIYYFGFRKYFTDRLIVFMLASAVVSFGLAYYTSIPRAAWWADIASIALVLRMFDRLDLKPHGYRGWRLAVAGICMLWSGFQLTAADVYAVKYAKEYPEIVRKFLDEPDGSYFTELADYPWTGIMFMQFNDNTKFVWPEFPKQFYWGLDTDRNFLNVVPEGLRKLRLEDAQKIDGNLGFYRYGPYLIAPIDLDQRKWILHVDVDYGWFKVDDRFMELIPFTSEGDGKRYVYALFPYNQTEYEIGNVQSVSVPEDKKEGLEIVFENNRDLKK